MYIIILSCAHAFGDDIGSATLINGDASDAVPDRVVREDVVMAAHYPETCVTISNVVANESVVVGTLGGYYSVEAKDSQVYYVRAQSKKLQVVF